MPRSMGFANGMTSTAITNNPVFKVKITSLDNQYEQRQPDSKKEKKRQDSEEFEIGDVVKGRTLGGEEEYKEGKIHRFVKDKSGNLSAIIVQDKSTEKEIKLDPSSCTKIKKKTTRSVDDELPFTVENLKQGIPRLDRLF